MPTPDEIAANRARLSKLVLLRQTLKADPKKLRTFERLKKEMLVRESNADKQREINRRTAIRNERKMKTIKVSEFLEAIEAERGLFKPIAERLCITRTVCREFIARRPKLMKALKEARDGFVDITEKKLFEKVEEGDIKAITFTLLTLGKDRGYVLPKGNDITLGDTNVTVVGQINIMSVEAGKFMSEGDKAITITPVADDVVIGPPMPGPRPPRPDDDDDDEGEEVEIVDPELIQSEG